jgi:serine/threonine protein phosphatase PrpC
MNCDSYFEIGSSHMICQDYALSGNHKNMWYGIVSDGCSSAEYSEIGAQILCHATKNLLMLYYDLFLNESIKVSYLSDLLGNSIRAKADEIRKIYPISRDSLQATLLISVVIQRSNNPTAEAFIFAWGDGVIIRSNGEVIAVNELDYPETNAPVYLMTDISAYISKFGPAEDKLVKQSKRYDLQKHSDCYKIVKEFSGPINPFCDPFVVSYPMPKGDFILLATDGLTQYQDQNKKPVKASDIIPSILDYPNFNGQFVKRTMNFMKRDLIRKSWSHADDIGIVTTINL